MTDANADKQNRDRIEMEMDHASATTGLHLTTALDTDACLKIAEALGLDQEAMQHIHRRVCNAKAHEDYGMVFAGSANAAFYSLRKIADKLSEIVVELQCDDGTVQLLLDLALCWSGNLEQHPEVRRTVSTLARYGATLGPPIQSNEQSSFDPSNFFDACMRKYKDSIYGFFALAVIEYLQETVNRVQALAPEKPRGSPGKGYRKAIICELALAHWDIFGEAPTCSPNGRFMLLCELVLEAMGESTDGLDKAVQRLLRSLKTS